MDAIDQTFLSLEAGNARFSNIARNSKNLKSPGALEASKASGVSRITAQDAEGGDKDKQKLKEACQGFEAIFLSTMMKSMRQTLPGEDIFGKSHGLDLYKSMYDQQLADKLAASGRGVGITDFFYKQLDDSKE